MKRRTMKSRLLAFLLVLCMIVGLTPVYAVSEGEIVQTYKLHSSMADDQGMVHVEFTPEEDGHYFLVIWPEFAAFTSCSHGAEPADSFGFDDDDGYGNVYELKAGQTYCFAHETREGYLYEAYMKKVSVPETFDIPETLIGFAGTEVCLDIEFEGALATEVTSSDLTVVNTETGGNAHAHNLELLKAGTATVTVTASNGVVKTCEITVKKPEQIALDEEKTMELTPGESVAYTFVAAESGNYIVHWAKGSAWVDVQMHGSFANGDFELITENRMGRVYCGLVAGQTYTVVLTYPEWNESAETVSITLSKGTETEGFTIAGNTKATVEYNGDYRLQFTPEFGVSDDITWTVSDESVAEIVWSTNTCCSLYFKTVGAVTLTATSVQDATKTAAIEITVEEPKTIQLGETVEVNLQPGESVECNFSANGKAGQYMLMMPWDAMCGWGWHGDILDWFDYYADECRCVVFELPEDGQMTVDVYAPDNEPVSTTLTLVEAIEATDISFPDGDTVQIGVGEQVRVPVELVGGNFIKDLNCYIVDDNGVAWPQDWCGDYIDVYANQVGTTTFVLEGDGVYKELTVNVLPYGYNIPDENKWVGTLEDWEYVTVEYTPENDGYYFFHHQGVPSLIPAEGSAEPLFGFEHNDIGGWGYVYQLEGGKTYTFISEWDLLGDYAYFVKEVFMADDFTIPAEITGEVNGWMWLQIYADGVVVPTYKSSNENVVLLGANSSEGVTCFMIGEGTADIIVTDQNGNEKVCTVTVSGTAPVREFYGGEQFGLAAGNSITYSFRPWESGLYWIQIAEESGVEVSLTANGEDVTSKFSYYDGKVYELDDETEYMLTLSSDENVASYVYAEVVEEATSIDFGGEAITFYEGEETGLVFELMGDNGNWAVAEITAQSSDESVVKITSCEGEVVWFETVGAGTATITVTTHNGLTDSIQVNVLAKPIITLDKEVKQTLKPNEGDVYSFTAEQDGYYEMTIVTGGVSVFATACQNDGSDVFQKAFEGPATYTHKQYMKAGEEWLYTVVNLEEEATIEATMLLTKVHTHILTKVNAVEPTYETAGNMEYYKCSICGKLFLDAEGKTETTAEAVVRAQLVKIEKDTAIVSPEAIDKAVEEAAKVDEVVIDVSGADVVEVELPVAALDTLVKAEKPLTVVTGETTVTLDAAAVAAVTESAKGEDITIRIEEIEAEELNEKQQAAVADREVAVTISAGVFAGDKYVGDFKGGKATIKVPMTLPEGEKAEDYAVFYLDDEGKLTAVETIIKDGQIYFVTEHFSEYVVLKTAKVETDPDVPGTGDSDNPNTGDRSNLFMMTSLFLFAVIGLAVAAVNGKKYAYVGKWER